MVGIPLYILLFVYIAYLAFFAIFLIVNFYHIFASGTLTLPSFIVTFMIVALTAITLFFTWALTAGVNWQQPIPLFSPDWFGSSFS